MLWKKHGDRLFIDAERIGCPIRGTDVDIETCMACEKLLRLVEDDPPYVVCRAWRDDHRAAEAGP